MSSKSEPSPGEDHEELVRLAEDAASHLKLERSRFAYLQRVLRGSSPWMNVVVVDAAFLERFAASVSEESTKTIYHLALSLHRLLSKPLGTAALLLELTQLFEELDFSRNTAAVGYLKVAAARQSQTGFLPNSQVGGLIKFDGKVVNQALCNPTLPFRLSPVAVALATLSVLDSTYERLVRDEGALVDSDVLAGVRSLDGRVKNMVLGSLVKGLADEATASIRREMVTLQQPSAAAGGEGIRSAVAKEPRQANGQ